MTITLAKAGPYGQVISLTVGVAFLFYDMMAVNAMLAEWEGEKLGIDTAYLRAARQCYCVDGTTWNDIYGFLSVYPPGSMSSSLKDTLEGGSP